MNGNFCEPMVAWIPHGKHHFPGRTGWLHVEDKETPSESVSEAEPNTGCDAMLQKHLQSCIGSTVPNVVNRNFSHRTSNRSSAENQEVEHLIMLVQWWFPPESWNIPIPIPSKREAKTRLLRTHDDDKHF